MTVIGAVVGFGAAILFMLFKVDERLRRIINLLDIANQQRGEGNFNLRSIDHNSEVIRERTPQPRDHWADDLIGKHPDRP